MKLINICCSFTFWSRLSCFSYISNVTNWWWVEEIQGLPTVVELVGGVWNECLNGCVSLWPQVLVFRHAFLLLTELSGGSEPSGFGRCSCFGDTFTTFTEAGFRRAWTYFWYIFSCSDVTHVSLFWCAGGAPRLLKCFCLTFLSLVFTKRKRFPIDPDQQPNTLKDWFVWTALLGRNPPIDD